MVLRGLGIAFGLLLLGAPREALAETAADQGPGAQPGAPVVTPKLVAWHDSSALFSQRVGTQTVGVGRDFQSNNPYYDWVFYLRPRYYFWENETTSLSVRGQLWASLEFTNNDSTTRRREPWLEDTLVSLVPEHAFYQKGDYLTQLTLSLPRVELPTSKASYDVGKIALLGVRAYMLQAFPLREGEAFLPRGQVALRIGYGYQFARSVVPERSDLNRLRMDIDGRSVSNDQVSGAALAEHIGTIHGIVGADLWHDKVGFLAEAGIDPAYRFRLPTVTPICGVVLTGCATPQEVTRPQRLDVATLLDVSVEHRAFDGALKTSLGYENIAGQLGLDGERRGILWSPYAKFYLRFEVTPDLFIEKRAVTGFRAEPQRSVASLR